MLDPKELTLLEMAERGELPDALHFPVFSLFGNDALIRSGKLTDIGETTLKAHRYEQMQKSKDKTPLCLIYQLEKRVSELEKRLQT